MFIRTGHHGSFETIQKINTDEQNVGPKPSTVHFEMEAVLACLHKWKINLPGPVTGSVIASRKMPDDFKNVESTKVAAFLRRGNDVDGTRMSPDDKSSHDDEGSIATR